MKLVENIPQGELGLIKRIIGEDFISNGVTRYNLVWKNGENRNGITMIRED